ncbi:hypothetical protein CC1G_04324 [Coprinopsis cinerea okayama7|uniref:FUN14 family protein n=1 Tax=Coprinopsis cinerea (strain Okayama-7 / 130 / ATCC MYA-4618 / FGSC 9003) TaxID=240176 RepID=A8NFQ3_COPC7|nr:hypothetical protein CC1G_04324 [Coprinopsis cinerea okayama7\|eukprot:XP_001833345.1 hypothetical protein CC1G_04324 [Coprinopsis cinerea okayama7\
MFVPPVGVARGFLSYNGSGIFARCARQGLVPRARLQNRVRHGSSFPTAAVKPGLARTKPSNKLFKSATITTVGLGLAAWWTPVKCDASPIRTPQSRDPHIAPVNDYPPPPQSSVSLYELSFGTVTGLCAGIFVKKGAKAAAWLLGGIFVLLQYLSSQSLVRVDWSRMASRFESAFHSVDARTGVSKAPTVGSTFRSIINFLTADFQPRASFVAGFVLGLRVG